MSGETKNKCVECGKGFTCKYTDEDSRNFAEACDTCPDCYMKIQNGWDPLDAADKVSRAIAASTANTKMLIGALKGQI